jgi:hypothetical protein
MTENDLGPQRGTQEPVSRLEPAPVPPPRLGLVPGRALREGVAGRTEAGPRSLDDYRTTPEGMEELLEAAWGLIANVSSGNWTLQTAEWKAAAVRWRDAWVGQRALVQPTLTGSEMMEMEKKTPEQEVEAKVAAANDIARRIREARAAEPEDG